MLVHRATSDSVLVEYYSARAMDYSMSLLTELKWSLLRAHATSEIESIQAYFQKWLVKANLGLEALQEGDMAEFRKWVFGQP